MAIVNGDMISGAVGPGVFYYRKGKKIIRSKPANYSDAKSPAQLINRERMRLTSRFIKSINAFIRLGYQDTIEEIYDNYSNEARQFIMKNCFTMRGEEPVLDYGKIQISRGEIIPPEDYVLTVNEVIPDSGTGSQTTATITWKVPGNKEWKPNLLDKVMLCMFSDSGKEGLAWLNKNMAERKDGTLTITIPKSDKPIHFWIFFHNGDAAEGESKKKISNSVYLGSY